MERPSWAPILLWGALPREPSDVLAISILALVSLEAAFSKEMLFTATGSWLLVMLVPLTTALAALSNSSGRQKEELALYAYGGSSWQIQGRYVLRGVMISAAGLIPILIRLFETKTILPSTMIAIFTLVMAGGIMYTIPGFRRNRSPDFVEHYKG